MSFLKLRNERTRSEGERYKRRRDSTLAHLL
jgi:hypothetical protein